MLHEINTGERGKGALIYIQLSTAICIIIIYASGTSISAIVIRCSALKSIQSRSKQSFLSLIVLLGRMDVASPL